MQLCHERREADLSLESRSMSYLIPKDIQRFLVDHIDSIAELEVMLFLREHHDRSWLCRSVADQMYSSEDVTSGLVVKLTKKGILTSDGMSPASFRYKPRNQNTARIINQLAEVYAKHLVLVTNLVHKKSRRNMTGSAKAFKLKRKK